MKKHIIILKLILLLLAGKGFSQNTRLKKAEAYFNKSRFAESTPILNEIADKINTEEVYRLAAASAHKSMDFANAYNWYYKLAKSNKSRLTDYENAFKFFIFYGKPKDAYDIISSNRLSQSNDPFIDKYKTPGFIETLKKDSIRFRIKETNLNSNYGEFGPCYANDGLAFSSARPSTGGFSKKWDWNNSYFLDIYFAKYSKQSADFEKKQKRTDKLQFSTHEGGLFYDKTNKVWYYTKNLKKAPKNGELVKTGIFIYDTKTRKTTAFKFNSEQYFTGHPSLSPDGSILWFSSDMPGSIGESDIWYSTLQGNEWSKPINAGAQINTRGKEMFPYATSEKLFFASDGLAGLGGLDIFEAPLKNAFSPGEAINCGYPLNSRFDDFAMIVDSTGENGYFSSNRKDYVDRIYSVYMKLPQFKFFGTVVADNKAKSKLSNIEIIVANSTDGTEERFTSDSTGNFSFEPELNNSYVIYSQDERYKTKDTVKYSTIGKVNSENVNKDLVLTPLFLAFKGIVKDADTKIGLNGVTVLISDKQTNETYNLTSDSLGIVNKNLKRNHEYIVTCKKKGYLDLTKDFNTNTDKESITGYFDLEMYLEKIKVGLVFEVKDIFYDYNKSDLRPESMLELDKLASFLISNDIKVELSSHTDSRGNDAYNMKLSQARAQSCVTYLLTKGVKAESITAKGYGESKLVNGCGNNVKCSEEEHQKNRRTEVKILKISESE